MKLQERIYSAIVRLHPPAFRRDFARDMMLDFRDALPGDGFALLFLDALLSLARQWTLAALPSRPRPIAITASGTPSLLGGQYVSASQGHPSALNIARAAVLYSTFIAVIATALALTHPHAPAATPSLASGHTAGVASSPSMPVATPAPTPSYLPANRPHYVYFGPGVKKHPATTSLEGSLSLGLPSYAIAGPSFFRYVGVVTAFAIAGWFATYLLFRRRRA